MPQAACHRPASVAPTWSARVGRALLFLGLPLGVAAQCTGNNDAGFVAFNAGDQQLTVQVGPDADPEPVSLRLLSTTETIEVGEATITPGGGPVGTEHDVIVNVLDDFEDRVTRVTVITAGERGEQTHLLVRDSADLGLWQLPLESLGAEGEQREDTVTVRLWRAADDGEDPDPDAEVDTGDE